jgi:hypothetical protein
VEQNSEGSSAKKKTKIRKRNSDTGPSTSTSEAFEQGSLIFPLFLSVSYYYTIFGLAVTKSVTFFFNLFLLIFCVLYIFILPASFWIVWQQPWLLILFL